jgi:hypothetical protein
MANQNVSCANSAQNLRDDIRESLCDGKASGGEADRDRRIEVASRYMADSIGHSKNCQAEGLRNAKEANTDFRELGRKNALPHPPKTSQNVPMNSAKNFRM